MENISKKHQKEFNRMKSEMIDTLTKTQCLIDSTLNGDSIIDNITAIRMHISLLKEFEETLVSFLGDALCLLKQTN